jgi:hypothetical protein
MIADFWKPIQIMKKNRAKWPGNGCLNKDIIKKR